MEENLLNRCPILSLKTESTTIPTLLFLYKNQILGIKLVNLQCNPLFPDSL